MKDLKNQFEILKNSFLGFVLLKAVFHNSGCPQDFEIIDANESFLKMINQTGANIIGYKISDMTKSLFKDEFDWISFFSQILLHGKSNVNNQYFTPLNSFVRIILEYIVSLFSKILVSGFWMETFLTWSTCLAMAGS